MIQGKTAGKHEYNDLHQTSVRAIVMLVVQFVTGMAVNLIGSPDETTGLARAATIIFLVIHILFSIGMIIGAVLTVRNARQMAVHICRLAHGAAGSVGFAFITGVLTVITKSNWWSYLMAMGFIAAFVLYILLLTQTQPRS